MVRRILNQFSSENIIFKTMLNFSKDISEQQVNLINLSSCIERYLKSTKRYESLQNCLKKQVQMKTKKIIFIGLDENFSVIMKCLHSQIRQFRNHLIEVKMVGMSLPIQYKNTVFYHKSLKIDYEYSNINTSVYFDIFYANYNNVLALQAGIDTLRENTGEFEPVLLWLQIPNFANKQQVQGLQKIDKIMRESKIFKKRKNQ